MFQGPAEQKNPGGDLRGREIVVFGLLVAGILWLGLYPQPVLNAAGPPVDSLVNSLVDVRHAAAGTDVPEPPSEATDLSLGMKHDNR